MVVMELYAMAFLPSALVANFTTVKILTPNLVL